MIKLTGPKIGLRNIKSAISVFICLVLLKDNHFYASIAAIICLQTTVANSIKVGKNRAIGTILGGLWGLIVLYFINFINYNISNNFLCNLLIYVTISINIIIVIYICNIIKREGSVTIACIVFIGVTTSHGYHSPLFYAVSRTVETIIGILISILVNKYFNFKQTTNSNNNIQENNNNEFAETSKNRT